MHERGEKRDLRPDSSFTETEPVFIFYGFTLYLLKGSQCVLTWRTEKTNGTKFTHKMFVYVLKHVHL